MLSGPEVRDELGMLGRLGRLGINVRGYSLDSLLPNLSFVDFLELPREFPRENEGIEPSVVLRDHVPSPYLERSARHCLMRFALDLLDAFVFSVPSVPAVHPVPPDE